jgi:Na+-transporting methylmalonyl-CoA/oxaloacetate decarboxylase gamma subunit
MFTLLGITGMAIGAIVIVALILVVIVFGAVKKYFPEKPRKPLRKA